MSAHVMHGIPTYLYYLGIMIVMAVSFILFARKTSNLRDDGKFSYKKIDLLQWKWIYRIGKSRKFPAAMQLITVFLFVLIILTGLFGIQDPSRNFSTVLTWTIWWIMLILFILFTGKLWCYICPWDAIATWIDKLHLWKIRESVFSLGKKWPRRLRNIYLATLLFLVFTWLELGWGVTTKPAVTAYLALLILFMSIFSVVFFDRKSFCRYGCLIGRISGLYALIAPVEIRARDKSICATCTTKDCYHGNSKGLPCPTFQYLGAMEKNTYCISCMECIKSCSKENATMNLRPFGADLLKTEQPRKDEAFLILIMLAMTTFHGLTMTPDWYTFTDWVKSLSGMGYVFSFTVGMVVFLAAVILFYLATMKMTRKLVGNAFSLKQLVIRNSYALLPIALFYHLAHNMMHFAMEGGKIVSVISDPFGFGWDLFGTAKVQAGMLIPIEAVWYLQVLFIVVGHVWSLYIGHRIAHRLYGRKKSFRAELPLVAAMIIYSVMSLYLVAQPMEMRTSL